MLPRRTIFVLYIALVSTGLTVAQDVDECSTPDVTIESATPVSDELDVAGEVTIGVLEISNDITHTWIGDMTIDVTSPLGTTLTLFDNSGSSADDILILWSDGGVSHDSDAFDCDCSMAPDGGILGLTLAEFEGEGSLGIWTLGITDDFASDDGTLNEWCVIVERECPVLPPIGFTCVIDGEDVDLEWTNGETYDSLTVYRDGEELMVVDAADESFTDTAPASGVYSYQVLGFVDAEDCGSFSDPCEVAIGIACSTTGGEIDSELDPLASEIDISEDVQLLDPYVQLDLDHTYIGDLDIELESPAGTIVRLHDQAGGTAEDMRLTFRDSGAEYASELFTCECEMQPSGPGRMSDFAEDSSVGVWTLTITDNADIDVGSLNSWCLNLQGCPTLPPEDLSCADGGGSAELSWSNAATYTSITLFRDGEELEVLDGTATEYSDTDLEPGIYEYRLEALGDVDDCANSSNCVAILGLQCNLDDLELLEGVAVESTIDVTEDIDLVDSAVQVDITQPLIDDLTIEVTTPDSTTVTLHDSAFGTNLLVTFRDTGVPYGSISMTCDCEMTPEGPGMLADFLGDTSVGLWSLSVTLDAGVSGGTLNAWCIDLQGCPVLPIEDLVCDGIRGTAELTWTNTGVYSDVLIYRDGELVESIDGASESYDDDDLPTGLYAYEVVGYSEVDDCSVSVGCTAAIGLVCNTVGGDILDDVDLDSIIEVADGLDLEDMGVFLDITHPFTGDLTIDLESPEGTSITLHEATAGENMLLTFVDSGVDYGSELLTCECEMAPSGPGELADYAEETSGGDWTLTIADLAVGGEGTLNSWCLAINGVTDSCAISGFVRSDVDGDGLTGIEDLFDMLQYQFAAGDDSCVDAMDFNDDGVVNLTDVFEQASFIFLDGPDPPAPYPDCEEDPTDDDLGCFCHDSCEL